MGGGLAEGPGGPGFCAGFGRHSAGARAQPPARVVQVLDLGAGCCGGSNGDHRLTNSDAHGGQAECQARCAADPACRYYAYGWGASPGTWCATWAVCARPLHSAAGQCGSNGNDGVRTYELVRSGSALCRQSGSVAAPGQQPATALNL